MLPESKDFQKEPETIREHMDQVHSWMAEN